MDHKDLEQKILGLIQKDKISPRPKWQFLFKNYVVWIIGALALIFGALSSAVIIYLIKFSNWEIYDQVGNSALEFIMLTMPYFWLVFLALFVFVVYYNIKHTKKGYRYPLPLLIIISLFGSLILGGIFFQMGWGRAIDDVLGQRAPLYNTVINRQMDFWSKSEEGRLAGLFVSWEDKDNIILRDIYGEEWIVDVGEAEHRFKEEMNEGVPVRLLGKISAPGIFEAKLILPMKPGGGFMKRPKMHPGDTPPPPNLPQNHNTYIIR